MLESKGPDQLLESRLQTTELYFEGSMFLDAERYAREAYNFAVLLSNDELKLQALKLERKLMMQGFEKEG